MKTTHDILDKLAWEAQRHGARGAQSLKLLQAELRRRYPEQFKAAIAKAKAKKKGARAGAGVIAVTYAPTLHRAIGKYKSPDTQAWYRNQGWPFSVTKNPNRFRSTVIVVWDDTDGFNVHDWVGRRYQVGGGARDPSPRSYTKRCTCNVIPTRPSRKRSTRTRIRSSHRKRSR